MTSELKEFADKVCVALNNLRDDEAYVKYDATEFSEFMQAVMYVASEKNKKIDELQNTSHISDDMVEMLEVAHCIITEKLIDPERHIYFEEYKTIQNALTAALKGE